MLEDIYNKHLDEKSKITVGKLLGYRKEIRKLRNDINNWGKKAEQLYKSIRSNISNRFKLEEEKIYDFELIDFIWMSYKMRGIPKNQYRFISVDEAQNINIVNYNILKRLYPEAIYNFYGDINQNIYGSLGISS